MKTYFEKHYPRRLAELKEELEPIAEECFSFVNDGAEFTEAIARFKHRFDVFLDNTKLHLQGKKVATPMYIPLLSFDHIFNALGGEGTKAGAIFKILYKKKGNQTD